MSEPEENAGTEQQQPAAQPGKVQFDYIKSNLFRVIHVTGAVGSISPVGGGITISLFNERMSIPQQTTHVLFSNGALGPAIPEEAVNRKSVVREVEVCAMLDLEAAQRLHMWLGMKIEEASQIKKQSQQSVNEESE